MIVQTAAPPRIQRCSQAMSVRLVPWVGRARMMDRVVQVLVEERNVKVPTQVMGRTTHGYIVYFDGDIDELRGQLVNVKIDNCQRYYLAGKRTDEPVTEFSER